MDCRWTSSTTPRLLRTHLDDCTGRCDGCEPCPERHCQVCGREHVTVEGKGSDQTCATCVGETRSGMAEVMRLTKRLMPEALHKGVDSEAANLAGPAINTLDGIEAYNWRNYAALKAGKTVEADDDRHPLWVFGTWEMLVREHLGQPSEKRITIESARAYLAGHLTRLAHDLDFAFEELARDIRTCVAHLERVLHEGEQEERGAPCVICGKGALLKDYGKTSEDEIRWKCTRTNCGQWYTDHDYRTKVEATYIQHADRLTASQMHKAHRVPEGSVRSWASKDKVRKLGKDSTGLTLYSVEDTLAMRDAAVLDSDRTKGVA